MPEVLRHLKRGIDTTRCIVLLQNLTKLARQLREHMRRWLEPLIALTKLFWDPSALPLTKALLALHSELASAPPPPGSPRPAVSTRPIPTRACRFYPSCIF